MVFNSGRRLCALLSQGGLVWALILGLSACGGGSGSDTSVLPISKPAAANTPLKTIPTADQTQQLLTKSAAISAAELKRTQEAADARATAQPVGTKSSVRKASAAISASPVYRFYNTLTGAHFYTISASERDSVRNNLSNYQYEGMAFKVSESAGVGLSPVHRFYNVQTGVHFYTISGDEKNFLIANLPQFHYEGIAYYASALAGVGFKPLYRFYVASKGFHFYTASEGEKSQIVDSLPQYTLENAGYFVVNTPLLPHTGATDQQCFEAGNAAQVPCGSSGALSLNSQQDGHRTAINSMSYSEVPKASGGNYARAECVKDNLTGLTWEGKTASGPRGGNEVYTHYVSVGDFMAIAPSGAYATQANLDATRNSLGYVKYVQSISLCGYRDWRLPSPAEMLSIVNYGFDKPAIDMDWFPNTVGSGAPYTTSQKGEYQSMVSVVSYERGNIFDAFRDNSYAFHGGVIFDQYLGKIRLVRQEP